MERLLRWAFGNVVRTGNLRITTARGSSFTVGDGTGKPLAMRFTSADAERGVLDLDIPAPELARRLSLWKPRDLRYKAGVFAKYCKLVSSASEGAVTRA